MTELRKSLRLKETSFELKPTTDAFLCDDRGSDEIVGSDLVELAIEILLGSSNFLEGSILVGSAQKRERERERQFISLKSNKIHHTQWLTFSAALATSSKDIKNAVGHSGVFH